MTTQTQQNANTMLNYLTNLSEADIEDIVENRLTEDDRETLLELVADLRDIVETREQQEQPPPAYEGDGWNLPSYESIQDSPPDYY